ncbi:hypothetical protein EG68_00554 [Paragonimus skrjabini miyazakii]|uniref:UPF0506 domain-containing protein n=1 Tax=Paragonimus skrjabini miyazakii TaxID=59628 RepID=A0A8S9Z984_9TREM|nr:hypothetical protein EG68_00554 [Paragonimus skrjabini miyazakii]
MRFSSRRLVSLTLYCYLFVVQVLFLPEVTAKCVGLNGACDGTMAFRCCGDLKCELHGAFKGKCKTCIAAGFPCTMNSQCCSRRCSALNCMEF